jgi:DNA-binding NarL/FixJ family response regulator
MSRIMPMLRRMLIVDDNSSIRHLLRAAIENISGWKVCGEAVNGREAIEKAQELKPNLIVLDLAMPIMNGLEAAPLLRRLLPTVPIILYTLHDNKAVERVAFSLGISAVVSKAAGMTALVTQAQDLLRTA